MMNDPRGAGGRWVIEPTHLASMARDRRDRRGRALLLICITLWATTGDKFAASQNLLQVARQASSYGMMAVGMVLLLSMGEIDLSVGSILTLVNVVTAIALREGVPMPLAVMLGLACGAGCGLVNGVLSVLLRIPTIIVTLGTMSVFRGVALVLSKATPVGNFSKENRFFQLGSGDVLGVPTGVHVMLLVALAGHVLLHHTAFGCAHRRLAATRRHAGSLASRSAATASLR